ncbi:MAG: response regulator [Phycisphaerae bacterium]|nr:response regulator [Phycisphaerae bacterium]
MNTQRPARVLLIDDDPDIHLAIRMILEPLGHTVACYQTGQAGLDAVRREPPDLVILDIMLTHPSEGLQVACELRRDSRLKSIPLVLMSAIGQSIGLEYGREVCPEVMSADMFLEKPFDAKTLREAVSWILEQQTGRTDS